MPKPRYKRRTRSEWTEILSSFESSGLSIRDFCHRESVSLSSFQRWRSRLGSVNAPDFVELVPAATDAELPEPGLELVEARLVLGLRLRHAEIDGCEDAPVVHRPGWRRRVS